MSFPVEKIQCRKVYLRNIDISDVKSIYEIYSDPEVTIFLDFPPMNNIIHAENLIDDILLEYLNGNLLEWAIIAKKNNTLIGTIRFEQWDHKHKHAKVGFALTKKWWGKGIMSDLLSSFIRFGFSELDFNRIQANINSSHLACINLFKKKGFQKEGILRERYIMDDDVIVFSLLKNELNLVN